MTDSQTVHPGFAGLLAPVLQVDELADGYVRGRVVFDRRFGFARFGVEHVHGGAIPLLFDEVFGELANAGGRAPARTAYLHVDYRNITPVGTELLVEARLTSEDGRKRFLNGTLRHGETVCAEVETLFVALRAHDT